MGVVAEKWALGNIQYFRHLVSSCYGIAKAATFSVKLVSMKEILMRSVGGMFEGAPDFSHSFVKTHSHDCCGHPSHMTYS